jgi:hypothetical protein
MLYQLIAVIMTYIDYEIVTRFQIQEITSMPNIELMKNIRNNLQIAKQLIDIYPQIKHIRPSKLVKSGAVETLLRKLLSDNKLDDFQRIVGSEEIIKTCHLMIDKKTINFSTVDSGVADIDYKLFLFNRLNYKPIEENKIEKITISLNDFDFVLVNLMNLNTNYSTHYSFLPNKNFKTKVTFSSFLTQKLSSFERKCVSEEDANNFDEQYFEFCHYECYFKETNQTFGCFPFIETTVIIERDIKRNGYKFCNDSVKPYSKSIEIMNKCQTKCKPKCRSINFEFKHQVLKHISNETILEFIPKKTPSITYIETLKTDLDRLIYNCGGVFGLWFGLTPIKTVDLIQYSFQIWIILRAKLFIFVHYLLAIFKRCINRMISVLLRFVRKIFANLSVFSHHLITFFIRCVRNSFKFLTIIVYQIIAIYYRIKRHIK